MRSVQPWDFLSARQSAIRECVFIVLHIHVGGVNHLLHGRGAVAESCGIEDEVGIFRVELPQNGQRTIAVERLILTVDGVGLRDILLATGKVAVVPVGTAPVVGEA